MGKIKFGKLFGIIINVGLILFGGAGIVNAFLSDKSEEETAIDDNENDAE